MNKARQVALRYLVHSPQGRSESGVDTNKKPNVSKRRKPCGCDKRKAWLNKMIPGSGDLVEKFTEATGIKKLVQGD